jgi:hypothetical protein
MASSVWLGDFNFVENLVLDKINSRALRGIKHGAREFEQRVRQPLDLTDVWRNTFPTQRGGTYTHKATEHEVRTRIDRAYATPDLLDFISKPRHRPFACSDHDAVIFTLSSPLETDQAPPRPIFDDSLLQNEDFVKEIWKILQRDVPLGDRNLLTRFDCFLGKLEKTCAKHASIKRKSREESNNQLTNNIIELDDKVNELYEAAVLDDDALTEALTDRAEAQAELASHETAKAINMAQSARTRWTLQGETPNPAFTKFLKGKNPKTTILSAMLEGREVTGTDDMLKSVYLYYSELYGQRVDHSSADVVAARERLFSTISQKLDPSLQETQDLEADLVLDELTDAIEQLGTAKVPGSDGLTVRFFRFFWASLGPLLLRVWNVSTEEGHLPGSLQLALITLIHKKQARNLWKNYRPISLLNISYKILSKALANRLKKVLTQVVNPDQTGCVPGRFIGENIMLYLETYERLVASGESGACLFLDFEKAFDRVDRDFMWTAMEKMNFGPKFVGFCKTLYAGSASKVLVNGHPSDRIQVQTGVRQGCPIAALLYLLACEPMATLFRSSPVFKGLPLPKSPSQLHAAARLCISQYCDDTLIYCRDLNDLAIAAEYLNLYEIASGQKVNYTKSPTLFVKLDPPANHRFAVLEDDEPQRVLGLNVGVNLRYVDEWNSKKGTLLTLFQSYTKHNLSIFGRVETARTYAVSKLWFCAAFHTPDGPWLKGLETLYERFCFGRTLAASHKYQAGKRKLLYLKKENQGYNAMHLPSQWSAFRAQWTHRLALPSPSKWKNYVLAGLDSNREGWHLGIQNIFNPIPVNHFPLSPMWREIIRTTRELHFSPADINASNFLSQPLFFNPRMTTNLHTPAWAIFTRAGFRTVGDLFRPENSPGLTLLMARLSAADAIKKFRDAGISPLTISDARISTRFAQLCDNLPNDVTIHTDSYRSFFARAGRPLPQLSLYRLTADETVLLSILPAKDEQPLEAEICRIGPLKARFYDRARLSESARLTTSAPFPPSYP